MKAFCKPFAIAALSLCAIAAHADQPWTFGNDTRYLAMGDSLTAGYGAVPMTAGYAFLLYEEGAFDTMTNTVFANSAVPGATSAQVLTYQVPMAVQSGFQPQVITMTVGGNDLFTILDGANPYDVLGNYQVNLTLILTELCTGLPGARITVGNLYAIHNFPVPVEPVVQAFNQVVAGVAAYANATACNGRVRVADVYSAFSGSQEGLLLINRNGASFDQAHPSNAGYRVMAKAFREAQ